MCIVFKTNGDLTLIQTLSLRTFTGSGPFTLFAPNNAAFEKLPGATLSDLLSNQTALVGMHHIQYCVGLLTYYGVLFIGLYVPYSIINDPTIS